MEKSFFSIVIPTLDEELFLPRLLKSLERQKYKNFEVVIVDANSSDKTIEEANKFQSKLPSLKIYSVLERNVSYQRNLGAEKAKGEYLVFFDADVQISPSFLAKIKEKVDQGAEFLTTYLLPDSKKTADMVFINAVNVISEVGNLIGLPFAVGANIIVKKEIFEKAGRFDEKVRHAEDYDFTQKVRDLNVSLIILKRPKLIYSLRRHRYEGRINSIRKNITATIHVLTKGPITKDIFVYKMGGGCYIKIKRSRKLITAEVKKYLKKPIQEIIQLLKKNNIRLY